MILSDLIINCGDTIKPRQSDMCVNSITTQYFHESWKTFEMMNEHENWMLIGAVENSIFQDNILAREMVVTSSVQ